MFNKLQNCKNRRFFDTVKMHKTPSPFSSPFRAGSKLTLIDNSDKDWWKGKCLGAVGVFPSTYVTKLQPGEKPLQVLQSVNINSAGGDGPIQLLRDQVWIPSWALLNKTYLSQT